MTGVDEIDYWSIWLAFSKFLASPEDWDDNLQELTFKWIDKFNYFSYVLEVGQIQSLSRQELLRLFKKKHKAFQDGS